MGILRGTLKFETIPERFLHKNTKVFASQVWVLTYFMYKNSQYAKAEKSRATQNRSYTFATVGLLSLINKFSGLVAILIIIN